MAYIFVDIPVASDWPTVEDLDARNAITDELDASNIGQFDGAGGGLGSMDFSYTVSDAKAAEDTIKNVIARLLPDREYSMRVSDD